MSYVKILLSKSQYQSAISQFFLSKIKKKKLQNFTFGKHSIIQINCLILKNFHFFFFLFMTKLQEFIETIKEFYQVLLDYVDNESVNDKESLFAELSKKIQIINQRNSPNDLKMLLSLILHIANNHYRNPSFVERIEEVLSYLKEQIEQTLSNSEIFKIFSKNKLILNILFKND